MAHTTRTPDELTGDPVLDSLQNQFDILTQLEEAASRASNAAERLYRIAEGGVPARELAKREEVERDYRGYLADIAETCKLVKANEWLLATTNL